ncbi:hypothetical protein VD0002_g1090 [Verticillium dahliae]|nr:hypothetical protein BJF96_g5759 [Verticillium dahliae]PNH48043.1 hypothetical protein VD0004_g364 [Verticillium dahliae]PNH55315.1 hypothetical protein VD0003_g2304 [Verticillium dahliae]PNH69206.1 hypothetical protein VD0002_g1090 [Verticillium dahliae]PNH77227.1 hypothetical protein VD0001_g303 [Verticillium dahliae]
MILTRAELLPYKEGIYLWKYVPSLALSIIFLSIFGILSLAHTWRMFQHRLWFCLPFVVGGYLEATGCVGRVIARNDTSGLMPYIIQSIFLLVPPSLFAASIYMVLGRIIRGLGPRAVALSIIRPTWLTKVFVVGDISAFVIQAGGAGMTTSATQKDLGNTTVIVGLCVQIAFFGLFVLAAVIFDVRYRRGRDGFSAVDADTAQLRDGAVAARREPFDWAKLMMMLYATSALILVRCTFRIIEYIMGPEGYLLSNEWPLFVFDLTLMALVWPFSLSGILPRSSRFP